MNSNRRILSLGDLGRIVTGKTPPTKNEAFFGGNIPFVTPRDMDGRKTIYKTERYLSEMGKLNVQNAIVPAGSIMVSCIGSDMGKVAIAGKECITNQQINSIIVMNEEVSEYIYYNLSQRKNELRLMASGSAQPILNKRHFSQVKIELPNRIKQRAIAHILGTLDDKIELNRCMNETLESIGRAIFKSWFVDFDPVHAKAEGRDPGLPPEIADLFPYSFEDSELGRIPKGWEVGVLGDIASLVIGGQWGNERYTEGHIPAICLRGCDMEDLRQNGYAQKAPTRFVKKKAVERRIPGESDFLIAASGAGPCGRPLWCSPRLNKLYENPVIYSNFVKRFSSRNKEYAVYLDRLFYEKFEDNSIQDFITGTSVPNLDSKGLLKSCRIVIPSKKILDIFFNMNQSIFNKLYSKENGYLSEIRDALITKLINGELRVNEVGKIIGNAT
jgi:type I restriction enzyme S subunit